MDVAAARVVLNARADQIAKDYGKLLKVSKDDVLWGTGQVRN